MKKYIELLEKFGKKTISKLELEKLFNVSSDEELFLILETLSKEQLIIPIKSSKTNGNQKYPIYLKYKISLPNKSYESQLIEINNLHPLLLKTGYLQSNPKQYIKYQSLLTKLNRYFFTNNKSKVPISRKERSFEIFDEEKVLDDRDFCSLLEHCGINSNTLLFYDTPNYCFNDYIPKRKSQMTLLICENKDIWFNIRRMMFENQATTIFDTHIDGVVYGCGNAITGKEALTYYTKFIISDVKYLYWGDIDRAGLKIYLDAIRSNPKLDISLFIPAYEKMLILSENRIIPQSEDERNFIEDFGMIYELVNKDLRFIFEQNIKNNKRIPQEIISYEFLKDNMR